MNEQVAHQREAAHALSRDRPLSHRPAQGLRPARALFRGMRLARRQARGAAAWRARRRHQSRHAPLSRPARLPHRAVRPARLRPLDAACLARRQHHLAPGRRHRAPARASRHRALAGVRRLLGLDAGAGLCRDASRAGDRACAARHLHAAALRARMVLPGRLQLDLPRRVRGVSACRSPRPSAAT